MDKKNPESIDLTRDLDNKTVITPWKEKKKIMKPNFKSTKY